LKYDTFSLSNLFIPGPKAPRPIFLNLGPAQSFFKYGMFARPWAQGCSAHFRSSGAPLKSLLKYDTLSLSNLWIAGPKAPRPIFLNLGRLPTFSQIWACQLLVSGLPAHFLARGPFNSLLKCDTVSCSQIFLLDLRRSERDSLYKNIVGPKRDKGSTCRLGVHIIMSTIRVSRFFG
jgi:hypothetical protein